MSAPKSAEGTIERGGKFGRYQLLHFTCLIFVFNIPTLWTSLAIVFQGYINSHHCRVPGNLSATDVIPIEKGPDGSERLSQCEMYSSLGSNLTVPCADGWEYDPEYFDEGDGTIVMEWDLVCDKNSYVELSITLRTLGSTLGTLVCTPLGDRFGRRKALFLNLLLVNIFSLGLAFSPNFVTFCVLSFAGGVFTTGIITCGIVLATELCPKNLYAVVMPLMGVSGSSGQCLLALLAYYVRGWRQLQLGVSGVCFAFLLYYRWCPESVRWCIAKGKLTEAKKILRSQAKMNGYAFNEEHFDKAHSPAIVNTIPPKNASKCSRDIALASHQNGHNTNINNCAKQNCTDGDAQSQWQMMKAFLRNPKLLAFMGVLSYVSFVHKLNVFGLHLLQANMSGNIYSKFAVNGAMSLPGNITAIFSMRWFGRKRTLMAALFICSIFFITSSILSIVSSVGSSDYSLYAAWLAVTAKPFVSNQGASFIIFSQELVPTSIRTTIFGILNGCGYAGTILSPFIAISSLRLFSWLPAAIFGVVALMAVFMVRILPETLGRGLPSSLEIILGYPPNLSVQEKKEVREAQRKEEIFGFFNKGFSSSDEEGIKEKQNSTVAQNEENAVTYI